MIAAARPKGAPAVRAVAGATIAATVGLLLLAGCGSESDVSTSPSSSASSGGSQQSASASVVPADPATLPALPPRGGEPDTRAVSAAIVGLSLEAAQAKASQAGYSVRIASVDGEPRALTMDYRPDRINVELNGDLVTAVTVG